MTLKSLNFSLLVISVKDQDLSLLADKLNNKRMMAPGFFVNAPVVVHIEKRTSNLDFLQIKKIVTEHDFILVGVSGVLSDSQKRTLNIEKIAILRNAKKQVNKAASDTDKPIEEMPVEVAQAEIPVVSNEVKTEVIQGRVRSGQRIHARGCDLVVNGDVSPGAEVIADGNIHIYGALRGRALAGANGDQTAAVFCRLLAPELVSIAGVYKLVDALPAGYFGKSCIVSLRNEQMILDSLN